MSPNGRYVTFSVTRGNDTSMWLRPLDSLEARPLPGTNGAAAPFWSPDGRFIGFFADSKLKKIDIVGGSPQVVCDAPSPSGGSWSRDDVIVFGTTNGAVYRVAASGGQAAAVTTVGDSTGGSHRWPYFLPDGKRFLFLSFPGNTMSVASLDSTEVVQLGNSDSKVVFVGRDRVMFIRQGTLFAQTLDMKRLSLTGESVAIAQQVGFNAPTGNASFDASSQGVLVYRSAPAGTVISSQLRWFDRTGKPLGDLGAPSPYFGIELSRDERRLAVHPHEAVGGGDIWVMDVARGTNTRITFAGHNVAATWSPDGTRLAIGSNRPLTGPTLGDPYAGIFNIFEKRADGTSDLTTLLDSASAKLPTGWKQPTSWSPDGQAIVFEQIDSRTSFDIWLLPMSGDRQPRPLVQSEFQELQGQISPDGKWLAYTSNESRRREVYVRPLSNAPGKWQVSTSGGVFPKWRADGKELFYLSADRKLMAADTSTGDAAFDSGVPHALFDLRLIPTFWMPDPIVYNLSYPYAVAQNGQRFLILTDSAPPQSTSESPIVVVSNWAAQLKD